MEKLITIMEIFKTSYKNKFKNQEHGLLIIPALENLIKHKNDLLYLNTNLNNNKIVYDISNNMIDGVLCDIDLDNSMDIMFQMEKHSNLLLNTNDYLPPFEMSDESLKVLKDKTNEVFIETIKSIYTDKSHADKIVETMKFEYMIRNFQRIICVVEHNHIDTIMIDESMSVYLYEFLDDLIDKNISISDVEVDKLNITFESLDINKNEESVNTISNKINKELDLDQFNNLVNNDTFNVDSILNDDKLFIREEDKRVK